MTIPSLGCEKSSYRRFLLCLKVERYSQSSAQKCSRPVWVRPFVHKHDLQTDEARGAERSTGQVMTCPEADASALPLRGVVATETHRFTFIPVGSDVMMTRNHTNETCKRGGFDAFGIHTAVSTLGSRHTTLALVVNLVSSSPPSLSPRHTPVHCSSRWHSSWRTKRYPCGDFEGTRPQLFSVLLVSGLRVLRWRGFGKNGGSWRGTCRPGYRQTSGQAHLHGLHV